MADRQKTDLTLTPRDLYVKSNPGLLGSGTDVTNPRDWYCSTSARKLLRSFVSQYNNVRHERLSGDALSKKVAFYVNFPALLKEGSSVGVGENEQLVGSSLQQAQGEITSNEHGRGYEQKEHEEGEKNNKSKSRDNDNVEDITQSNQNELLSSIGRMKSFMFALPTVEGSVSDDQQSSQYSQIDANGKGVAPSPNQNSISLPKLSTRTVTFNVEKRRENKQTEDPFDMWLAGVTNEVQSAKSYLNRTKVGTKKSKRVRNPEASVRRKLETLSAHTPGGSPRNSIPDQYMELLLPKHQAELTEAQQFYDKYPWRQKSVLNLKLDFGKDKKPCGKTTDRQYQAESSEGGESESGRRKSKRRVMSSPLGLPLTKSQGQQHQPKGGDILGFFPYNSSEKPLMKVVSTAAAMGINTAENQPGEAMAIPVEALEEHLDPPQGGGSDPSNANSRFVYKAPGDKFLLKPSQNTKTSIVTLGLNAENVEKADTNRLLPSPKQLADRGQESTDTNDDNDAENDVALIENSKKTQKREEETTGGPKVKSKAALRHYKRLEVFGERKADVDKPEAGGKEKEKQKESVADGSEKSLRTNYKPITRPPTYRLDEREYRDEVKVETVTLKVKVNPTSRDKKGQVTSESTGSVEEHAQMGVTSLTEHALVIERLDGEKGTKPQNPSSEEEQ